MKNDEHYSKNTLSYAIARTYFYQRTFINKIFKDGSFDITSEQWFVLKIIDSQPGTTQTEIAYSCLKDKTNITRILDQLEKRGYIERQPDEKDRRIYRIHLRQKGKEVLKEMAPIQKRINDTCAQALNDTEYQTVINGLNKISSYLKQNI